MIVSPNLEELLAPLLAYLSKESAVYAGVMTWGSPILSFGDISKASIATIGLNPSCQEFLAPDGSELDGSKRRFHTLKSLELDNWSNASSKHVTKILTSCADYFDVNPYNRWFKQLDELLISAGASYYRSHLEVACHLDLVPFATREKWGNLNQTQKDLLIRSSGPTLGHLLKRSPTKAVILNGAAVVNGFTSMIDASLRSAVLDEWSLPRSNGKNVPGLAYNGKIDNFGGVSLGREVLVLGYNHNIQSSFGVTRDVKRQISMWIGRCLKDY